MTAAPFEDRPETARGIPLHESLLAVHAMIRSDLARVERLAADVLEGLPPEGVHEQLVALKGSSLVWQFQVSCLRYCSFVHLHHHVEDIDFFGELEGINPALAPVVDRLRSEHRTVSGYLDAIEAAARSLSKDRSHDARRVVADRIDVLKGHLLAHLDFEESNVAAMTRRLPDGPSLERSLG